MPVPSMPPTTWFVPETTRPEAVLLLTRWTRFPPVMPKAETLPASSSVAPAVTVAVAPAATDGIPEVTLNLSVPPKTVVSPE